MASLVQIGGGEALHVRSSPLTSTSQHPPAVPSAEKVVFLIVMSSVLSTPIPYEGFSFIMNVTVAPVYSTSASWSCQQLYLSKHNPFESVLSLVTPHLNTRHKPSLFRGTGFLTRHRQKRQIACLQTAGAKPQKPLRPSLSVSLSTRPQHFAALLSLSVKQRYRLVVFV